MTPTRETFGNISDASQWVFYFLVVATCAVFGWGLWRRFRLWRQGQPQNWREFLQGPLQRLKEKWSPGVRRVAIEGFGQQRVRGRGLPSYAHALLVAGFLILFLGTSLLELDHLASMVSRHLKFHQGTYYVLYEYTLDVFGVIFIAGVTLFLARRAMRPPSVGHRSSDWWVLWVFLGIGITGYGVEAMRIGWQHPTGIAAHCSPVGLWLSSLFPGWTEPQFRQTHVVLWWIHSLLVFGFIASIPFTRLIHFVTGPLNLFLAQPSLGVLQPITMEEVEKLERVGVSQITHFQQQQLLSLDACMECGRCQDACPAYATQKPLSPKKVVQDLRSVMNQLAQVPKASPGADARSSSPAPMPTPVHEVIDAETLWSCTACSACTFVCPVRVDPVRLILDLRRHLVADGGLSGTAAVALRRMQSSANPWGLPANERAQWLSIPAPSGDSGNAGETPPSKP